MRTRATIRWTQRHFEHIAAQFALLAAFSLLALLLTGCSSNDDSDDAAPASSSASTPAAEPTQAGEPTADADADLVQAVKDYTAAYFASDTDRAYAALSERCQGEMSAEAYGALVKQAKGRFGPDHPATDVETDVQGEMARVTYKVQGLPEFDQTKQPWAFESGEWKFDAC